MVLLLPAVGQINHKYFVLTICARREPFLVLVIVIVKWFFRLGFFLVGEGVILMILENKKAHLFHDLVYLHMYSYLATFKMRSLRSFKVILGV